MGFLCNVGLLVHYHVNYFKTSIIFRRRWLKIKLQTQISCDA